jgi:hypothetical protein
MNKRAKQNNIEFTENAEVIPKKEKPKKVENINKEEINKYEKIKNLRDYNNEKYSEKEKKMDEHEPKVKDRHWQHHIHIHIHGHHCHHGDFYPPQHLHQGNFGHHEDDENEVEGDHYNGQYSPNIHEHHGHSAPLEPHQWPGRYHGNQNHHSVNNWDDVPIEKKKNSMEKGKKEDSLQGKSEKNKVNQAEPSN